MHDHGGLEDWKIIGLPRRSVAEDDDALLAEHFRVLALRLALAALLVRIRLGALPELHMNVEGLGVVREKDQIELSVRGDERNRVSLAFTRLQRPFGIVDEHVAR